MQRSPSRSHSKSSKPHTYSNPHRKSRATTHKRSKRLNSTQRSLPPESPSPQPSTTPLRSHRKRVAVGISGGVDSATTAALLLSQGYDVIPIYMSNWDASDENNQCTAEEDLFQARKVANHLGLQLHEVNFTSQYWTNIFETVLKGYANGITPNPDILCNKHIKFGVFFDYAMANFSPDYVATGHYARVSYTKPVSPQDLGIDVSEQQENLIKATLDHEKLAELKKRTIELLTQEPFPLPPPSLSLFLKDQTETQPLPNFHNPNHLTHPINNQSKLMQLFTDPHILSSLPHFRTFDPLPDHTATAYLATAVDSIKDQTYFLSAMPPEKLCKVLFPIGHIPKKLTRAVATVLKLPNFDRKDSMGVCFVGQKGDFGDFLSQYLSDEQQYPGTMLSTEQFIDLMQIYLQSQHAAKSVTNAKSFKRDQKDGEDDSIPESRAQISSPELLFQQQPQKPDLIRETATTLDDWIPTHLAQNLKKSNRLALNIPIQDQDRQELQSELKFQQIDETSEQYTKRLQSLSYPDTIPLSDDQLIPQLPSKLQLAAHFDPNARSSSNRTQNAQIVISSKDLPTIARTRLPFNQQQHERIQLDELPVVAEQHNFDKILSVQYNSSPFLPTLFTHAHEAVQNFTSALLHAIPPSDPRYQSIKDKVDNLTKLAAFLQNYDIPAPSHAHLTQSYGYGSYQSQSSKKTPPQSTTLQSLSFLTAIPLFQQLTRFISQLQQQQSDLHPPSSKQQHSNNTTSNPPPSLAEFVSNSAPIWFDAIQLVLEAHKQGNEITNDQIKALRSKHAKLFPQSQKSRRSNERNSPKLAQLNVESTDDTALNQKNNTKCEKLDSTQASNSHQHQQQQQQQRTRGDEVGQSIYHQQSEILLKLLPTLSLQQSTTLYTNTVAGKGLLEHQVNFNITSDSSQLDSQNDASIHPPHIQRLATDQFKQFRQGKANNSQPNQEGEVLSDSPPLSFTSHNAQSLQSIINSYLNPTTSIFKDQQANTAPSSSTSILDAFSTAKAAQLTSRSIFKQLQRIHYQIQSTIIDIISFRTKLSILKNSKFKFHRPEKDIIFQPPQLDQQSQTSSTPSPTSPEQRVTPNPSKLRQNQSNPSAPTLSSYILDTSTHPVSFQWKRAFQNRNRIGDFFPIEYQSQSQPHHQQSTHRPGLQPSNAGLSQQSQTATDSLVNPATLLSSLRPSPTLLDLQMRNQPKSSHAISSTFKTLVRTVSAFILHNKSYKRWFGLYHGGLTRYTENQRIHTGLGAPKECVLSKIPQSNTLLYCTGDNHPFSIKSSCILPDFIPLSYNPLHLMQIPAQENSLSVENYSNEAISRLQRYSQDLFTRTSQTFRLWAIVNEYRLNDDQLREKSEQTPSKGKGIDKCAHKPVKTDDKSTDNQRSGAAQRAGPPPMILQSNTPVFTAYKALFPFSDYGLTDKQSKSPVFHALGTQLDAVFNTPTTTAEMPSTGFKAYAKLRSTGKMLPCRLILEDVPYSHYISASVQKMNPSNIVSFIDSERSHSQKVTLTRHKLDQLYSLLNTVDSELLQQDSKSNFHPLQLPLIDSPHCPIYKGSFTKSTQFFHQQTLESNPLGKLRNALEKEMKKLETNLHLIEPTWNGNTNTSSTYSTNSTNLDAVTKSVKMSPSHRRVLRVMFDQSQEYLSNGQTIAIYIPLATNPMHPASTPNNAPSPSNTQSSTTQSPSQHSSSQHNLPQSLQTVMHQQFNTINHDDFEYEASLYSALKFDIGEEYTSLLGERSAPISQNHLLFDPQSSSLIGEMNRQPSLPSAFDRFICLGSGTIAL